MIFVGLFELRMFGACLAFFFHQIRDIFSGVMVNYRKYPLADNRTDIRTNAQYQKHLSIFF